MGRYDTAQQNVGRTQEANGFYIKDGGFFDVGDVKGGANGSQFTGRQLQLDYLSRMTQTFLNLSTNSVLAVLSTIAPAYGYINLSQAAGGGGCSIALPVASKGAVLVVSLKGVQSDLQLKASGVSLVGFRGSNLTHLSFLNGSANSQVVTLACAADGVWSVVNLTGSNASIAQVEVPS